MTYCVALKLNSGMVFLSDTRTNAGVDLVNRFRKMTVFEVPGERMITLMTAGNLSISQSVVQYLMHQTASDENRTLWNATNMFQAARLVGEAIRKVHEHDAVAMKAFGVEFNVSFIVGGQIGSEEMRLFQVYAAGNFIEATPDNPYFQIGEAKYGKPIVDRVITPDTPLDEAAKCALISMDSTLRSNISVGLPLDLLCYEKNSLAVTKFTQITQDNQYYQMISKTWGARLREVFGEIDDPMWTNAPDHALAIESAQVTLPVLAPRPQGKSTVSPSFSQYLAQG
ncbi:MAG: peptidase [Formosimonas sp.]